MKRSGRIHRGIFITFEGIEGSGKTTQRARLAGLLHRRGYRVVETREPGGTAVGEALRRVLLETNRESILPRSEALLICASRCQHTAHVIRPALEQGAIVLCDRFSDSTLAYQGYARGMKLPWLRALDRFATGGLRPDLTLLFDVPVSQGLGRRRRDGTGRNRLDLESRRFHQEVRRGYLGLAAREPRRIKIVDGRQGQDTVATRVSDIVLAFLTRKVKRQRKARNK